MKYIEDRLKPGATIAGIILLLAAISCKKESKKDEQKVPTTYTEMFSSLGLQFNKEYRYEEWHTYNENGTGWAFTNRSGTILFNLADTSMTEKYKGFTTKDGFRLLNFFTDRCAFESLGYKKYDTTKSVFIATAWQNLSINNGQAAVGWSTKYNGVYSAYQLKVIKP
jgi:hypothetical protein